MKYTAIIKTFFRHRKFGFLLLDDGKEIFFHQSDFVKGVPVLGSRVEFELGDPVRLGLPKQAINITPVDSTTASTAVTP